MLPTAVRPSGGKWGMGIALLLLAGGIVFVAFPARILECDAVMFSSAALHRDIDLTCYPHHLAYNLLQYGASLLSPRFDPPLNPIYILQYLSMAAGLGGVYLLYRLLTNMGVGIRRALLFSGSLLLSYGYWHYSRQADVHILSACLLILFAGVFYGFLKQPSILRASALGIIMGLATIAHQSNILLVPPMLLACYLRKREGVETLRPLRVFAGLYLLTGILPYLLVARYLKGIRGISELYLWLMGASARGAWGAWRLATVPATAIGLIRTFTGSHYLLAFGPMARLADRTFPASSLLDETAIAAWGSDWLRLLLLSIQAIILVFAAKSLVSGPRRLKHMLHAQPAFALFLIGWLAILGTFFAWWAPGRVDFWIAWLPALLIVLAFPLEGEPGKRTIGTAAVVAFLAGLFTLNFLGSVYPQSGPISERDTETLVTIDAVVNNGDIVISDCYFAGRVSVYARSFERVNLLDAVLAYPSPAQGTIYAYRDGRSREIDFDADRSDSALITHLKDRTICRMDSLVSLAAEDGRDVYLLMSPVGTDPARRHIYGVLVDVIEKRYDLSDAVPLRGDLDMRRIPAGHAAR